MSSRVDQFDEALKTLTQDRGVVYGHPIHDFGIAADIKQTVSGCGDPLMRHVLDQIAVKMARLCTTPDHLDSWIDIAGYARTALMVLDARTALVTDDPAFYRPYHGEGE